MMTDSKKVEKEWQVIDIWRDAINHGLRHRFKDTNIILQGGVDDVWFEYKNKRTNNC